MTDAIFPTPEPVAEMPPPAAPVSETPQVPVPDHTVAQGDSKPRRERVRIPLGENKKPKRSRGRPRDLTEDDLAKLRGYYEMAGIATMPFNAAAATSLIDYSETCVESWKSLAEENDNVRRAILGVLEGGAWGAVFAAHVPIMLSFMPGHVRSMLPGLMPQPQSESSEDDPNS